MKSVYSLLAVYNTPDVHTEPVSVPPHWYERMKFSVRKLGRSVFSRSQTLKFLERVGGCRLQLRKWEV